jgi:hypothetical protein
MASLQQTIDLIKAGKKSQAREALVQLVRETPDNVQAWFWLVDTFDNDAQRVKVLEQCLKHNPENKEVRQAYEKFRARVAEVADSEVEKPKPATAARPKGEAAAQVVPVWLWLAILVNAVLFVVLVGIGLVR